MQLAFYFDQTRCTGCHTCVVACKDWNDLPAGEVSWRRVATYEEGVFPNVKVTSVSISCNHCRQPACADACPENAIFKREEDGIVLIDDKKCTGCRLCESSCQYGAIQFGAQTKAEKCSFCLARLKNGEAPICVAACPMRALGFGDFKELAGKQGLTSKADHLPDGRQTTASLLIKTK